MIDSGLQRDVREILRGGPIVIATDFDGTLAPIAARPESVELPASLNPILDRLAESGNALLFVVSGRPLSDLHRRVSVPCVLGGNHGLEVEGRGYRFEHAAAEALRPRLAALCTSIGELLPKWPGAWLEDKRLTATVHFRAIDARAEHGLRVAVRRSLAPFAGEFGLRAGKKALEIHPRVGWNKGQAVNWLREASGIASCICIGDDRTDETMFRECSGAISVVVGRSQFTAAQFRVDSPAEVEELLCFIADESTGQRSAAASP